MNLKNKICLDSLLRLSIAPTSIEDFSYLTDDPEFARILCDSSLYMIVKRPCLLFKDLLFTNKAISGNILQIGSPNVIEFELPLYQNDVIIGNLRNFEIKISYNNNYRQFLAAQEAFELSKLDYIDSFLLYETQENGGSFLKYITPDALIERYYNSLWTCTIIGDITDFLCFEVLYIGEAVRSNIWKRLEKHETLQKILSQENPTHFAVSNVHEINILFFEFQSRSDFRAVNEMSKEEFMDYLTKKDQVSENKVFFDIEKAFIKFLKPKYNIQLYQNYPASSNGLMPEGYNYIQYSIKDPILLRSGEEVFNSNHNIKPIHSLIIDFSEKRVIKSDIN